MLFMLPTFTLYLTFSSGIWLGLGIYVLILIITLVHIGRSPKAGWVKTVAMLGVVVLPIGGLLDWWWGVIWGSRTDQIAQRKNLESSTSREKPEVEI